MPFSLKLYSSSDNLSQKTNKPEDLQPSDQLLRAGGIGIFNNPGPFIPSDELKKNLPPAAVSRGEMHDMGTD
jgi:hypothetical protein